MFLLLSVRDEMAVKKAPTYEQIASYFNSLQLEQNEEGARKITENMVRESMNAYKEILSHDRFGKIVEEMEEKHGLKTPFTIRSMNAVAQKACPSA